MDKLAQATAHARAIFEIDGFKYLTSNKVEPDLLLEAATFLENEKPLPVSMGAYTAWALRMYAHKLNGKKRKPEKHQWRNLFIVRAVREMQEFGFKPTRSPNRDLHPRECGCSIVKTVLKERGLKNDKGRSWKEGAVVQIWKRHQKKRHLHSQAKALLSSNQKPIRGMFAPPPA